VWGDRRKVVELARLVMDTRDMAHHLSLPFNPKWSIRRMKEEHDRMTQIELAKKYSKDTFKVLKNTKWPLKYEHEELTAYLLMSPFEMQEEGRTQRHCVAGYSSRVEKGEYLVYSIRDAEGKRVSTAGFTVEDGVVKLQQHYGFGNSRPTEEARWVVLGLVATFNDLAKVKGAIDNPQPFC
jgi:hypothetical protein